MKHKPLTKSEQSEINARTRDSEMRNSIKSSAHNLGFGGQQAERYIIHRECEKNVQTHRETLKKY